MQSLTQIFLSFILTSSILTASGQYKLDENWIQNDPSSWYLSNSGLENNGILIGERADIKIVTRSSHQFFLTNQWTTGEITFRGIRYDSIHLLYDIYEDKVFIYHPTGYIYHNEPIEPIQSQVSEFNLSGHHFVRMNNEKNNSSDFYEDLYDGESLDFLAFRYKKKEINRTVDFERADKHYFYYQDTFYPYRSRVSLYRLFPEDKKTIRNFIRTNHLSVKPKNEGDCIKLMRFVDLQIIKRQ